MSDPAREWTINDAVTENLDLPELLRDYLSQLSPNELEPAFGVLRSLTVCDPTVGSGAFLFAALDVLEPLYLEVVERAKELRQSGQLADEPAFLREAEAHPSQRYWLLKTICLHNLYGVDIMHEAPEIAKLRLFLKLAAQIDNIDDLEPLPDLDFNIKCGNLLVGIANPEDATNRLDADPLGQLQLDWGGNLVAIQELAKHLAQSYDHFVTAQVESPGQDGGVSSVGLGTPDSQDLPSRRFSSESEAKRALEDEFRAARERCDELLHRLRDEPEPLEAWVASHQPFHWFVEFPSVWRSGGFDVIIGNPPYIKTKKVTGYRWINYETQECPDLYAVCVERSTTLLKYQGRFAMILMHSLCFSQEFESLRDRLSSVLKVRWYSSFSNIPDCLFAAKVGVRNSIVIGVSRTDEISSAVYGARLRRWTVKMSPQLFASIQYCSIPSNLEKCGSISQWPFLDVSFLRDALGELMSNTPLQSSLLKKSPHSLGFKNKARYQLSVFIEEPPTVDPQTGRQVKTKSSQSSWLHFGEQEQRDLAFIALAGRWGYLWWLTYSDEFNVTRRMLTAFPGDIENLAGLRPPGDMELVSLLALSRQLREAQPTCLAWKRNAGVDVGRYNMLKLRHLTDRADWLLAKAWGIEWVFEAAGNLRDRMIFGNKE